MKYLAIIFVLLSQSGCKESSDDKFTESSTEDRQLTTLSISLDPSGGLPSSVTFYGVNTRIGASTRRISDGVAAALAVKLSQEELERIRSTINGIHGFSSVESFQSIRSPETSVKAPGLPEVETILAREDQYSLQIRSNSIFHNAYYISEFGMIYEDVAAQEFLRTLRSKIQNEEVRDAIDRILARK